MEAPWQISAAVNDLVDVEMHLAEQSAAVLLQRLSVGCLVQACGLTSVAGGVSEGGKSSLLHGLSLTWFVWGV